MNELERMKEEEKKAEWFTKYITKHMILENLIQYVFSMIILKITLLIWVWQRMNKAIRQSILNNSKVRQDYKILT